MSDGKQHLYKRIRLKQGTIDNLKALWQETIYGDNDNEEDPFEGSTRNFI